MNKKNIISLNGKWNFIKDAEEKFSVDEINKKIKLKKYDGEMNVPSNWEKQGLHNFNGTIWFIKAFPFNCSIPNRTSTENNLIILNFLGVDYFADVWLNGNFIGHHEGYFQPFDFDVSKLLNKSSNNILVVKVNSPFEEPRKVWPA